MTSKSLHVALVAILVVLAGCSGGIGPGGDASGVNDADAGGGATADSGAGTTGPPTAADPSSADGARDSGDSTTGGGSSTTGSIAVSQASDYGSVDFYLSDRPSAIDQFDSLTVTVTQVAFHRAGAGEEDTESDTNTTDGATGNETETETNETETPTPTATPTETSTDNTTETTTETTESPNETTTEPESEPGESTDGDAGWITYQVDGREADLTQLQGPNATLVGNYDLPSGKYTMVRVTVESPTGVLNASGETVTVKVPSNRLRINRPFTVGANETLSFVFDITVVEAGGSGKFVLTPVIGQSGTKVPFKAAPGGKPAKGGPPTDNGSAPGNSGNAGPSNGAENATLEADILGKLQAEDSATLRVTANNRHVSGATVTVEGTDVGQTDDRGRIEFAVPDSESITVIVTAGGRTTELNLTVSGGGGTTDGGSDGGPPENPGQGNRNGPDK